MASFRNDVAPLSVPTRCDFSRCLRPCSEKAVTRATFLADANIDVNAVLGKVMA